MRYGMGERLGPRVRRGDLDEQVGGKSHKEEAGKKKSCVWGKIMGCLQETLPWGTREQWGGGESAVRRRGGAGRGWAERRLATSHPMSSRAAVYRCVGCAQARSSYL